jgi:predicted dienelactone hydrolase
MFNEVSQALVQILPAIPDPLRPLFSGVLKHINGPSSAYADVKADGKRRPLVLLLHGLTGPRWAYTSLAELLAEHGFIVVALERKSFFLSSFFCFVFA